MARLIPDLPIPKHSVMRRMKPGQTVIFRQGGSKVQPAITAIQNKIGGKFTQKTLVLVEPGTCECMKVVLVTCVEPADPLRPAEELKKRGRKSPVMDFVRSQRDDLIKLLYPLIIKYLDQLDDKSVWKGLSTEHKKKVVSRAMFGSNK